jgi:nicotinamide-nucleotide amidase
MNIGILTIGNELTSGRVEDTNSSFIARTANTEGWQVSVMMSVGDNDDDICKALDHVLMFCDAAVVTGGLGPTVDDITTVAIAKAYGLRLYMNEAVLAEIKALYARYRVEWTPNSAKQAMFPEGSETIYNPVGTAWGFVLNMNGTIITVVPGVPREVRRIVPEGVIPLLRKEAGKEKIFTTSRTLKLLGMPEAKVDQALSDVDFQGLGVSVGFYPRFPQIHVQLTVRDADEVRATANLNQAMKLSQERLSKHIFGYDNDTLEQLVSEIMTSRGLTLAVAESCTGGLIADLLTNVSGSSKFFERGVVAYSNASKTDLLGVPAEVIEQFGAVSEETAVAMAAGVRQTAQTDFGIATTGIAGPTGGTDKKPVGTVYIAVTDGRETICRHFSFRWDRRQIKEISSHWALDILRRRLIEGKADE